MQSAADCEAHATVQGPWPAPAWQACEVGPQQPKGQEPNKGSGRGGGKRANTSDGWYRKHCDFYNFGYRPVCFKCKKQKAPKKDSPGVPATNPRLPAVWSRLKKQICRRQGRSGDASASPSRFGRLTGHLAT
eukprot:1420292-Amphidinium_carterae.1